MDDVVIIVIYVTKLPKRMECARHFRCF